MQLPHEKNMEQHGISVSIGISWRDSNCNSEVQFDEADRQMYEEKAKFYTSHDTDRQKTHNCKAISTYNPVDPIILYLFIF